MVWVCCEWHNSSLDRPPPARFGLGQSGNNGNEDTAAGTLFPWLWSMAKCSVFCLCQCTSMPQLLIHAVLLNFCVYPCISWSQHFPFPHCHSLKLSWGSVEHGSASSLSAAMNLPSSEIWWLIPLFLWSYLTGRKQKQECWGTVVSAGTLISN